MAKRVLADIRSLCRAHTESAVNVLQGIMNEKRSPPASRIAAAEILMSRGWGKPVQQIAGEGGGPIKVQAIAWLDTIDASDRAKVIEGTSNGQKALTNAIPGQTIWENRAEPGAEQTESGAGLEPARTNTDDSPDSQ